MNGTNTNEDEFVKKIIEITKVNLHDEQFGVSQLAGLMGMSRITFLRKVKSNTNLTVSVIIRELRLKRAYELLLKKKIMFQKLPMKLVLTAHPIL